MTAIATMLADVTQLALPVSAFLGGVVAIYVALLWLMWRLPP
jgi:hypothetical protein